jgi:biotin transport system substrate-specific component
MTSTLLKSYIFIFVWFSILLAIGPFAVNMGELSITLQSMLVLCTPLIFTRNTALLVVIGYLMLGALGLPVLAGYTGGVDRLFAPTAGFLWGFSVLTYLLSFPKIKLQFTYLFVLLLLAHFALVLIGSAGYTISTGNLLSQKTLLNLLPGMLLKSALGAVLVRYIHYQYKRKRLIQI